MLSHIKNSTAGREKYEVHTDSLFRVTFIPPAGVTGTEILTEQCINVTGWKVPGPEAVQQQFMQARRNGASVDVDSTQNITTTFELNLNENLQNYVYNTMIQWKNLVFNHQTGERGLRRDYMGSIVIESFAANGDIYWVRTLRNVWPSGEIADIGQNDVTAGDPVQLSVNWVADYYEETNL